MSPNFSVTVSKIATPSASTLVLFSPRCIPMHMHDMSSSCKRLLLTALQDRRQLMGVLIPDNPLPLAFHPGIMQRLCRGNSCSLQFELGSMSRSVSSSSQLS